MNALTRSSEETFTQPLNVIKGGNQESASNPCQKKAARSSLGRLWSEAELFVKIRIIEPVLAAYWGHILYSQFVTPRTLIALKTAIDKDLFTVLEERDGLDAVAIASLLEMFDAESTEVIEKLLQGNLIRKRGLLYKNTILSRSAFSRNSPRNVLEYAEMQYHSYVNGLRAFEQVLETHGPKAAQGHSLKRTSSYGAFGMPNKISKQMSTLLPRYFDFSGFNFIVDIGGGTADNLLEISKWHPKVAGALMDFHSTCEHASQSFIDAGVTDQFTTIPGNFLDQSLPAETDCALFCHFLTIWTPDEINVILRRTFDSLSKGGTVVIFNMLPVEAAPDLTDSFEGTLSLQELTTGKGMLYDFQDFENFLRKTGFAEVKTKQLPMNYGVIWAVKPV